MTASASGRGADRDVAGRAGRTLAQTFCLLTGLVLIAVGVLGFFTDGSEFEVGSNIQGDELIVFEVNGWHNIVHLATGGFLLLMAMSAATAITGAIVFGVAYAAVTAWGFVDGNDVLGLIPVNTADNILHLALAATALAVGLSAAAAQSRDRTHAHRTA